MRRYRRRHIGSHKPKGKIIFRIFFVLFAAAALAFLSVCLGSHLKEKAAKAVSRMETDTQNNETEPQTEPPKTLPEGILSQSSASKLSFTLADVDPSLYTAERLNKFLDETPPDYNGVSVRVTSDGKLVYASPAALNFVRISDALKGVGVVDVEGQKDEDTDEENNDEAPIADVYENIKQIVNVSKAKGLRSSCIFETTALSLEESEDSIISKTIDKLIIGELSGIGFDEIIIDGLVPANSTLDFDAAAKIINYLTMIRSVSGGTDVGIMLPAAVYLDAPTANLIVNLSKYADFLAIKVSMEEASIASDAYDAVYDACYLLKGNFSVYNMRAVIDSNDAELNKSAYEALKALSVENIQFLTYVDDLTIKGQGGDEPPQAPSNMDGVTNGNASTKDKYTNPDDDINGDE